MNPYYYDYSQFLSERFDGKVQKISINAGFTCPNRDGTKGSGGCTYCNNHTFTPTYIAEHANRSVEQQITDGIAFFSHKYPSMRYLAYFQSYTNTYASINHLLQLYHEALKVKGVVGILISTRPDMVSEELLDQLEPLTSNHFIMFEIGIESTSDETLRFINRRHTFADAIDTVNRIARRRIEVCAHLILGLPHEERQTILDHATNLSKLPISTLKLHQLQIIRNTVMHDQWQEHPEWFSLASDPDTYIDLCIDFTERLRPNISIERFVSQSPRDLLIAPEWGMKNHEFTTRLLKRMEEKGCQQGKLWRTTS